MVGQGVSTDLHLIAVKSRPLATENLYLACRLTGLKNPRIATVTTPIHPIFVIVVARETAVPRAVRIKARGRSVAKVLSRVRTVVMRVPAVDIVNHHLAAETMIDQVHRIIMKAPAAPAAKAVRVANRGEHPHHAPGGRRNMKEVAIALNGVPVLFRVKKAVSFLDRARGFMGVALASCTNPPYGMYFARCGSVHTLFMRFDLDLFFLDRRGYVLRASRGVKPFRMALGPAGTAAVLELPSGSGYTPAINPGDVITLLTK